MSKQRRAARAERERLAAQRATSADAERRRAAKVRARRERRALLWRRLRLWQHGPAFRRNRERWGALAAVAMGVLLIVYLVTRSAGDVVGTALILLIALPVLVVLIVNRSRP